MEVENNNRISKILPNVGSSIKNDGDKRKQKWVTLVNKMLTLARIFCMNNGLKNHPVKNRICKYKCNSGSKI